jgi:hypothetical protein
MPERGYIVFHKPIAAVYECVLQAMAVRKQKQHWAINQMVLMNPAAPLLQLPKLNWRKMSLKFLARPKMRGNNMKRPVLSSFCLYSFRSVIRFPSKILVPEILNLLTLVVRNCNPSLTLT